MQAMRDELRRDEQQTTLDAGRAQKAGTLFSSSRQCVIETHRHLHRGGSPLPYQDRVFDLPSDRQVRRAELRCA